MTDAWRGFPLAHCLRKVRATLLVLMTALVLVQCLGVLHRVAHVHVATGAMSASSVGSETQNADEGAALLARLWGEHSSLADCQLFDQMSPDLLVTSPLAALHVLPAPRWKADVLQARLAQFERFYASRGPPAALI